MATLKEIDAKIEALEAKLVNAQSAAPQQDKPEERSLFGDAKAWMGGKDVDPSIPIYNQGFGT